MGGREIDGQKLGEYSLRLFGYLGGAMTSAMVCLGDRLGLYRALADGDPVSSAELAQRVGLEERWVREWLFNQGAAGLLEHHEPDRFSLSAEGCAVLSDETHPAFGAGFFDGLPANLRAVEKLPEAFRTGLGLNYDAFGEDGARGVERGLAPWFRALLVPGVLPRITGVPERLKTGTQVADVGCGAGVALLEIAKAFPASEFHGYDISQHALARAEANRRESGIENAEFHDARSEGLPEDGRFGFVTTFDCLHDMADPARIIAQIRRAIAADGVWLVADIKCYPSYRENVERNPMAAMMYGTSVLSCMSSALSEPNGLGLGTLGLHADLLKEMVESAGFTRFEALDLGHPVNAFYRIEP